MPTQINEFIKKLLEESKNEQKTTFRNLMDEFIGYMQNEGISVRVVIYNSPNLGHHANTIHILHRFLRYFRPQGQVEVLYDINQDRAAAYGDICQKLKILVPYFSPEIENIAIEEKEVKFLPFINVEEIIENRTIGISGGYDEITGDLNLADIFKTEYFWLLQPYKWKFSSAFFIKGQRSIFFEQLVQERSNDDSFWTMTYCYEDCDLDIGLSEDIVRWYTTEIEDEEVKKKSKIVLKLREEAGQRQDWLLWPVYGVHVLDEPKIIPEVLYNIIYSAKNLRLQGEKILIIFLSDFGKDLNRLIEFLTYAFDKENISKIQRNLMSWYNEYPHYSPNWVSREIREWYSLSNEYQDWNTIKIHPDVAETTIEEIKGDNEHLIHALFLGRVPLPMFRHLFMGAGLPPIFEGQSTASFMLSSGKPFIHFNRGNNTIGVNSFCLGEYIDNYKIYNLPMPEGIQDEASSFIAPFILPSDGMDKEAKKKYGDKSIRDRIRCFCSFINNSVSEYKPFFKQIQETIRRLENDKFFVGMAIGWGIVREVRFETSCENAMPKTLEDIFLLLNKTVKTGKLDISTLFSDSQLAITVQKILGKVVISGEDIKVMPEYNEKKELIKIILSKGRTDILGLPMNAEMEFVKYIDGCVIQSTLHCESEEIWEFLPWVQLQNAGFEMSVSENGLPAFGAITGRIGEIETRFRIAYPLVNGMCKLWAEFENPITVIEPFFQLAGNLNFMESLPLGLKNLGKIGVSGLLFAYNIRLQCLQTIVITLSSKNEWVFCENPRLSVKPVIEVSILEPASFENRHITVKVMGTFCIGEGEDAGVLTLAASYPPFWIQAQLTKNKIMIRDLLHLFLPDVQLEDTLAISSLEMFMKPETGKYSLRGILDTDWKILTGFTITGIGMWILRSGSQTAVSLAGSIQFLPDSLNLTMRLAADYTSEKGFRFVGMLENGGGAKVSDLISQYCPQVLYANTEDIPSFPICKIQAVFESKTKHWSFEAASKAPWKIPALNDMELSASVKVGTIPPEGKGMEEFGQMLTAQTEGENPIYASIWAECTWEEVDLLIWYNYCGRDKNYGLGITCKGIGSASLSMDEKKGQKAEIELDAALTLGGLVRKMVTWCTGSPFGLEEPWNLLESISLGGLKLIYYFGTKEVEFSWNIGFFDLGIAKIEGISLTYASNAEKPEKKGLFVEIKGSFAWETGDSLKWDASQPGDAPEPPASGSSYFALRTLAMGQHLLIPGLSGAGTVEAAMKKVEESFALPEAGKLPPVAYDEKSGWLFASDFGILKEKGETDYMINVQIVFNDPNIYALRLRLNGTAAKVFKGLDVQVLYRKVTNAIGVFQAEITLPDAVRYLSIGAYSLTLPVFGLAIYTNGDFQVDIGFPWNGDFSRSLALEAILYPGIPIVGAAGIYFGKLSQETAGNQVPHSDKGRFQPVLVFGFGLRIGIGKSVHYGILSAGFSLTVFGILEGVLAKWNPYKNLTPEQRKLSASSALEGDYYYKITGTVGISGHIFGSIDFAIIKADVDISLQVSVQFTVEAYAPVVFTVMAAIHAALSLMINLGLFKIRIQFSFSVQIKESFRIGESGNAPWDKQNLEASGILLTSVENRLSKAGGSEDFRWDFTRWKDAETKMQLEGYLLAAPVLAANEWGTGKNHTCMTAMLLLDKEEAFPLLLETIACFLAASVQKDGNYSKEDAQRLILSKAELDWMIDFGLASSEENLMPLNPETMEVFLKGQFLFNVLSAPKTDGETEGVYFPMPAGLSMSIDIGEAVTSYTFGEYNELAEGKLLELRRLFDELAVKVQEEEPANICRSQERKTCSVGKFLFADYFLLVARQAAQELRDQLRNYYYELSGQESIGNVIAWIKAESGTEYGIYDILAANMEHPLNKGNTIVIRDRETYQIAGGDTIQSILRQKGLELKDLARKENEAVEGLFCIEEDNTIFLPHLEKLRLCHLLKRMEQKKAANRIGGMVSRYHLHGLRIPTEGIVPKVDGIWVQNQEKKRVLPPMAGLYALTGQQFEVPMQETAQIHIIFDAETVEWLQFETKNKRRDARGNTYEIVIAPEDETRKRLKLLKMAGEDDGFMDSCKLSIYGMKSEQALSVSFVNPAVWTLKKGITLPVKGVKTQSILTYPIPEGTKGNYQMYYARYDEAEGSLKKEQAVNYGWATSLTCTVRGSVNENNAACTYELVGMKQAEIKKLERLLAAESAPSFSYVLAGYVKGQDDRVQSDGTQAVDMAIIRLNLSTETHPSIMEKVWQERERTLDFLTQLWEGSITNSGGYYFYYWNKEEKRGLPKEAFDEEGMAQINLLVGYDAQEAKEITEYMNLFICGYTLENGTYPLAEADDGRIICQPMVAPGVMTLGCERAEPKEAEDIKTLDNAKEFLARQFSLLSYHILENGYFIGSGYGMPCGPSGEKILLYKTSLPYSNFAKDGMKRIKTYGQQSKNSPYVGIGHIFEVESNWLDYYGNCLAGAAGKKETSQVQIGYGDRLMGLFAWTSIIAQWKIQKTETGQEFIFWLDFDVSRYQSSQGKESAKRALVVYRQLYDQLMDANGVELLLKTSLLKEDGFHFRETEWKQLMDWLFEAEDSVWNYLEKTAADKPATVPEANKIRFSFEAGRVNNQQLFPLSASLKLSRKKRVIMEGLEDVEGILETESSLTPYMDINEAGSKTVEKFAEQLEEAFGEENGFRVMAAGTDAQTAKTSLYIIKLGKEGVQFSFPQKPVIGVFRPISNCLRSSTRMVPLRSYSKQDGLSKEPAYEKSFTDIDMDGWMRIVLKAADDMLSRENAAAIHLVDLENGKNALLLERLHKAKKLLADSLSALLIPVFAEEKKKLSVEARESMRQKLLDKLEYFYQVQAVLDYAPQVQTEIEEKDRKAPRFYGQAVFLNESKESVLLSDGKLEICNQPGNMAVSVSAPDLVKSKSGEVLRYIEGKTSYHITHVERDIHEIKNIQGFEASQWLGFITAARVETDFQETSIPLVLRSFPDSPVMEMQKDLSMDETRSRKLKKQNIKELLKWDYAFTYSIDYHYPQDEMHCAILWNQKKLVKGASLDTLFEALAQFVEIYPQLKKDMDQEIAALKPGDDVKPVQKALEAFTFILCEVAQASISAFTEQRRMKNQLEQADYTFRIAEGSIEIDGKEAYMMEVYGEKLNNEIVPEILAAPEDYEAVVYISTEKRKGEEKPLVCYIYRRKEEKEEYLAPEEGQKLPQRTVCLRGLNLLYAQNALAQMSVVRNCGLMRDAKIDNDKEIADSFIYSTGKVTFQNPYFASKEISKEVIIGNYGTLGSIKDAFQQFFKELFVESAGKEVKIQMEAKYARMLRENMSYIEIPIFMQIPVTVKIDDEAMVRLMDIWEAKIMSWLAKYYNGKPEKGSLLKFDLLLFSSLTPEPRKLLQFMNLELFYQ